MFTCYPRLAWVGLWAFIMFVQLCSANTGINNPMRDYMFKSIEKSRADRPISLEERDPPKPCCYPKTWQGIWFSYVSGQDVEYEVLIYEDSTTQNIAADVTVTKGDSKTPLKYKELIKFDSSSKNAMVYTYDNVTKKCQSIKLANLTYDNVSQQCMPADAFYFGTITLGIVSGGANLPVQSWMWKPVPDTEPGIHYERIVTSDCAPTLSITRGTTSKGEPYLQSDYFLNIQTSISDPSVFNVPDYCKPPTGHHHASHANLLKFPLLVKTLL